MIERIVEISHRVIELSSRILADAFQNDPLFKHALPDNRQRKKRLLALFACSLQYGDMFGEIYSASRQGLAIWLPPGNCRITVRQSLQAGKWLIPLKIGLQAALHLEKLHIVSESLHKRYAPDLTWKPITHLPYIFTRNMVLTSRLNNRPPRLTFLYGLCAVNAGD